MDKNNCNNNETLFKIDMDIHSVIYFKEDRKRNCLKCQFCLFFVSVNVKQGARPFYQ